MTRYLKVAPLALLALLICVPLASARPGFGGGGRGGGFGGGFRGGGFGYGGYGGFSYGAGWYGPGWGWGWGWPGWYGPGWYGGYDYAPSTPTGKVKIDTKAKDTQVYVDGGYAGTVKQLGTFHLKTGAHTIELRHPNGQTFYQQRIDVIRGNTTDIKPSQA